MIRKFPYVRSGALLAAIWFTMLPGLYSQTSPQTPDVPPSNEAPTAANDYIKSDVMIPMRDGVRLHTVIVIPRGAKHVPIILSLARRTTLLGEPREICLPTCCLCCPRRMKYL